MLVKAQKLGNNNQLTSNQKVNQEQQGSRYSKLRSKKVNFPDSTLNKMVFVSNDYGNGFRRQQSHSFDIPTHIDLNKMLYEIDLTCFKIWEQNSQREESDQLINFKYLIWIIFAVALLLGIIIILISPLDSSVLIAFSYMFCVIAIISLIVGVILFYRQKKQYNYDYKMIYGIKKKLMKLNQQEYQSFQGNPRFVWSCHKECLWIAITFN